MSKGYRVTWEIDVWADSPLEAARRARNTQLDPATLATCFEVIEHGTSELIGIDLDDHPV